MSLLDQFTLFAQYNQVMNQRQYAVVRLLSEEEINKDQKAFFKSIFGTLNHILVGDIIWLKRFASHYTNKHSLSYLSSVTSPQSLNSMLFDDFSKLSIERAKVDQIIINWISELTASDFNECISYNSMRGQKFTKKSSDLMNHLFMHQVHHRGQISTLLSQFGIDFGETDLVEFINECYI